MSLEDERYIAVERGIEGKVTLWSC